MTSDQGLPCAQPRCFLAHVRICAKFKQFLYKKRAAFGVKFLGVRFDKHTGFLRELTPVGAGMTTQEKGAKLYTILRNTYISTSFPRTRESTPCLPSTCASGIPVSCLIERGPPRGISRNDRMVRIPSRGLIVYACGG